MTDPGIASQPLVVGLGSPDRGDDAVGPAVARRVAALGLGGTSVLELEDPTSLIDLWTGHHVVIVVDAVCSNQAPGTLVILELGEATDPLPEAAWATAGRGGSHDFGLAAAVELGRALHRLPERLVLVGIEAAGFVHGTPLSAPVADAVVRGTEAVIGTLWETGALPSNRSWSRGPRRESGDASRGGGR